MKTFIALILGTTLVYAFKSTEPFKPQITSIPTSDLPHVKHKAFQVGEKLRYRVTYGFIDAGEATLELKSTTKKGDGRELIHAVGIGKTLGGFNTFYRVYDKYETFLDKSGVFPWFFKRRVDEGGHKISQDYTFRQEDRKVVNEKVLRFPRLHKT